MAFSLGIRLPALRSLRLEDAARFARSQGIAALDLPADYTAAAQLCREQYLRIGSVDGVAMGQLIARDGLARAAAHLRQAIA